MDHLNNSDNSDNSGNTTQFWIKDPSILLDTKLLLQLWPIEWMTREEKLNAISRFVIFSTVLGILLFRDIKIFVTGAITLGVLVITYHALNNNDRKIREGFTEEELYARLKGNFTTPSMANPLMNVSLPEISDNPQRFQAAPAYNKAVEQEINDCTQAMVKKNFDDEHIDEKLFKDLGDKFEFDHSMRQFYATANTQVPNNQAAFAKYCYGNTAAYKDRET